MLVDELCVKGVAFFWLSIGRDDTVNGKHTATKNDLEFILTIESLD